MGEKISQIIKLMIRYGHNSIIFGVYNLMGAFTASFKKFYIPNTSLNTSKFAKPKVWVTSRASAVWIPC